MTAAPPARNRRAVRHGRPRSALMSDINVTPMVDVMLVLLVIFMVTAPLLTVGVEVDLPETRANPIEGEDEPVAVTVDAEGRIFVQETPVELADLGARLRAVTEANPDLRVFVRGDQAIDYGRVMEIVGTIHAVGYNRVALVTESTAEAEEPGAPERP